jgi:hypothetical protein
MLDRNFMQVITGKLFIHKQVMVVMLLLSLLAAGCILSTDDKKVLETLRQIAAKTSVYPSFSQIDSRYNAKSTSAVVSFYYRSAENYREVKNFYTKELTAKGWGTAEEDTYGGGTQGITFKKGEYTIDVFYDSAASQGWEYAISYSWERP